MKYINNVKRSNQGLLTYVAAVLCILMLSIRDIAAIDVSKYIILIIVSTCIISFDIEYSIYFYLFLLPLYFGLPGNYITIVFLCKCLFSSKVNIIKLETFICFFLFIACVYYRVILDNTISIVIVAFAPSVFIIVLIVSMKETLDEGKICLFYSLGVAALGAIMLISTLKVHSIGEILTTYYRLGTKSVNLISQNSMKTVTDPNYYGFFVIGSVSISLRHFLHGEKGKKNYTILFILNLISVGIAIIGLSRTFVICLIITMFMYMIKRHSIKAMTFLVASIIIIYLITRTFLPDIYNAILTRFNDETVSGGNGRVNLIVEFFSLWSKSVETILLGTNLFACNVHCLPLQFLFGGGVLCVVAEVFLVISLQKHKKIKCQDLHKKDRIPEIVVIFYSLTVPVATMINVFSPILVTTITSLLYYDENSNDRKSNYLKIGKYIKPEGDQL